MELFSMKRIDERHCRIMIGGKGRPLRQWPGSLRFAVERAGAEHVLPAAAAGIQRVAPADLLPGPG